jgi:predicted RNA-binding Zn-ribbon protein involved in translation (DUF1610 family)
MVSTNRNRPRPLVYRCSNTGIYIITHNLACGGAPVGYLSATPFNLHCPCCGEHHIFQAEGCRSFSSERRAERSAHASA